MSSETTHGLVTRSELRSGPLGLVGLVIGMFADFERCRDPPGPFKTQHVRLITIKTSHFCEKARWVLDLVEADETSPFYYTEDPHPPLFHAFASVEASHDLGSKTPCVLIKSSLQDDRSRDFISESAAIQRHFLRSAYPPEIVHSVQAMEDYLDEKLGPPVRCLLHCYLLLPHYQHTAIRAGASNTTKIEQCLFTAMFPLLIGPKLRKVLNVSPESAAASKQSILEIFDNVTNRLRSNGEHFIMDSHSRSYGFTAADLTFAALVSPLLLPEEHPLYATSRELPSALSEFCGTLRKTVAGRHALRMYREHRLAPGDSQAYIKCVDRNRSVAPWCPY